MKKLLLAAMTAVLAVCGVTTAWASSPSQPASWKVEQVHFIARASAVAPAVWDSTVTQRVGVAGASSVFDTTAAIGTNDWPVALTKTSVDSGAVFCQLIVYDTDGASCESGADSLGVIPQVSPDGVTWTNAQVSTIANQTNTGTSTSTATRNNQTILGGVMLDQLSLNGAALANGAPVWSFSFKDSGAHSKHVVDWNGLAGWPYIRFILSLHDAKGYKVQAKLGHFTMSSN